MTVDWPPADRDDDTTADTTVERGPVYQPRCVMCGREHYALNVIGVSNGQAPCHNCGKVSPVFYNESDYWAALRAVRERLAARRLWEQT